MFRAQAGAGAKAAGRLDSKESWGDQTGSGCEGLLADDNVGPKEIGRGATSGYAEERGGHWRFGWMDRNLERQAQLAFFSLFIFLILNSLVLGELGRK